MKSKLKVFKHENYDIKLDYSNTFTVNLEERAT
jgi:hypothetical protein